MTTISLRLPDSLLALLEKEAKARRVSKSQFIRDQLQQAVSPRRKRGFVSCYDLTKDLIRSVPGVPKDLATNPKYMEGFGR